jgi:RNA-directed DNA polymerase
MTRLALTPAFGRVFGLESTERAGYAHHGRYYRSALYPLLRRVNVYLRRWAGKKYKRLRTYKRFKQWWVGLLKREPGLFAHWQWVPTP